MYQEPCQYPVPCSWHLALSLQLGTIRHHPRWPISVEWISYKSDRSASSKVKKPCRSFHEFSRHDLTFTAFLVFHYSESKLCLSCPMAEGGQSVFAHALLKWRSEHARTRGGKVSPFTTFKNTSGADIHRAGTHVNVLCQRPSMPGITSLSSKEQMRSQWAYLPSEGLLI